MTWALALVTRVAREDLPSENATFVEGRMRARVGSPSVTRAPR